VEALQQRGPNHPPKILAFLCGKAGGRKLRLFAAACCRHARPALALRTLKGAEEATEVVRDVLDHIAQVADLLWASDRCLTGALPDDEHWTVQASLLRCLFGNSFRPVPFHPDWRTPAVLSIARRAHAARDFEALPVLADALEDAGCDSAELLAHCRAGGKHWRGCWAIDAVLGRE
jgi:hypothetical protein